MKPAGQQMSRQLSQQAARSRRLGHMATSTAVPSCWSSCLRSNRFKESGPCKYEIITAKFFLRKTGGILRQSIKVDNQAHEGSLEYDQVGFLILK